MTQMIEDTGQDSNNLAVLAYRMGAVEGDIKKLLERFDSVAANYVTTATLILMLEPVKERVKELEDGEKSREQKRSNEQAQFRLAIAVAVISPILSIVINMIINIK